MTGLVRTLGKWIGYALLAALALVAFKENGVSRAQKERAARYVECMKANQGSPDDCAKAAGR